MLGATDERHLDGEVVGSWAAPTGDAGITPSVGTTQALQIDAQPLPSVAAMRAMPQCCGHNWRASNPWSHEWAVQDSNLWPLARHAGLDPESVDLSITRCP